MSAKARVTIKAKNELNFAACCVGQPTVSSIEIENVGDIALKNTRLVLRAENDELVRTSYDIDEIPVGGKVSRSAANAKPSASVIQKITEEYESAIHAELFDGAELIGAATHTLSIQPVDMWAGFAAAPALAGFCIPNHPALDPLCARVSQLLKLREGSSTLNGYGNVNSDWPVHQARAAYDALLERGLSYSLPPESFGHGQRIRLTHRVLEEKKGTCIDLAFTYASLLGALRLDPVIVMYDNHAFAGFWTKAEPERPSALNVFNRSKHELNKLVEGPEASIVLVECTVLTHGENGTFEAAVASANRQLSEKQNFEYWLDIKSARKRGGRPMPLFLEANDGEEGSGNCPDCVAPDEAGGFDAANEGSEPPFGPVPGGDDGNEGKIPDEPNEPSANTKRPAKDEIIDEVRAHAAELGYNPVTRALMGEPLAGAHEEIAAPAFVDPTGLTAPLVADASQLHAVQYVAQGGSCVIEGSPGTGKTQVIVNIAADSIARDRKILVVLQNEDQLDVVQKRMRAAAMGPFVLRCGKELSPSRLLEQLDDACSLDEAAVNDLLENCNLADSGAAVDAKQGVGLARELDAYGIALSQVNAAGLTLREQIEGYQEHRDANDIVFLDRGAIEVLGSREELSEALRLVDDLCSHAQDMGGVRNHPLRSLDCPIDGWTPREMRRYALDRKAEGEGLIARLEGLCADAGTAVDREDAACAPFVDEALGLLADLRMYASEPWFDSAAREQVLDLLDEPAMIAASAEEMALQVESVWKDSLFSQSASALALQWEDACRASLMRRGSAKREVIASLQEHAWRPLVEEDVGNALGTLAFYEGQMDSSIACLLEAGEVLVALMQGEMSALDALADAGDSFHEWGAWVDLAARAQARGLLGVVACLESGADPVEVAESAKKELFRMMCAESVRNDERVRRFSGPAFERSANAFADVDEGMRGRAARLLLEHCSRNAKGALADKRFADQVERFKVALRAHGRGFGTRDLIAAFSNLLLNVCPCVLATPLGAARYLEWGMKFDLVVIDEASQLETARAIGVLERAEQVVVVGDPQQLPPTSFFARKQDLSDLGLKSQGESILDDCAILGLPKISLRWHYRSRHESLIAFSNDQFYRGRLLTFPSSDDLRPRVSLRRVEGSYDGGGTNRAEAEAIVEELKHRFELSSNDGREGEDEGCGIGVITFNVKQQALVNDLLKAEFAKDASFAGWAQRGSSCLFVRNLENVQGDERDVILLSITYARDAQNKLSLNFGPVNKAGGERRLNVAFTRSRCEMVVFAALSSGDICVNEATAKGVRVMRDFLAYAEGFGSAEKGRHGLVSDSGRKDAIAERLCALLEGRGYQTRRNVGASLMKVDVAVVDPRDDRRYMAGILLDGETYQVARSTRDREIGKLSQLRDLGWSIHRVWAVDLLFDERRCIERVATFLGNLSA